MRLPSVLRELPAKTVFGVVAAVIGAIALCVAIGYQIGGATGVRVVALVFEAIALVAVRASLAGRVVTRQPHDHGDVNAGFTRYRQFVALLRPAAGASSDFERSIRPLLLRLYGQTLATRYGVSLARDRRRARELMGDAAWLLDDVSERRVEASDLALLVSKLEELAS